MTGKQRPTAGDTRADGTGRNLEDRGDLGVIEGTHIAQHDGGAELEWQELERLVDREPVHDLLVDRGCHDIAAGIVVLVGNDGQWTAPASPKLVEARVGRNSVRPRREGRATVEAMEAADDGDQCFLSGIGGVGAIPGEPDAQCEQAVVVPS